MTAVADTRPAPGLDALFSALASAPRREIVSHLADGPTTTPEIGRRFDFTKQALNRHLVALEDAGVIERRLDGRVHTVHLVPGRLGGVTDWAHEIRVAWSANLDRLGAVLAEQDPDGDRPDDPADDLDDQNDDPTQEAPT